MFIGDLLLIAAALAIAAALVLGYMGGRRLWKQYVADRRALKREDAAFQRRPVASNDAEGAEAETERTEAARVDKKHVRLASR